mmetsp:Transcript_48470/g.105078  ORF Transcript_48470/g.105078 Transcript_48470/m.105078 type:complete len:330 (+) Transcript_48470:537-1526(+)
MSQTLRGYVADRPLGHCLYAGCIPSHCVSCLAPRSLFEERLERGARAQTLALFLERLLEERQPLQVRVALQHLLKAVAHRVRVKRIKLLLEPALNRDDLLEQRRGQILQPYLTASVDQAFIQLVVLQESSHLRLDLALHPLPDHGSPLLQKLLPEQDGAPEALVVLAAALAKREAALDRVREPRLLVERLLRVDNLQEEVVQLLLLLRRVALVNVDHVAHLRLEVRVARLGGLRVEDLLQLHAADDAVLPDVLDAVLRLSRNLLEIVQVKDDTYLSKLACFSIDVRNAEATRAVHQDVIVHLPVSRLEDIQHGRGVRQIGRSQREKRHD